MKKTTTNCVQRYRQQGFTLVEVMVAITISLVMVAGILQVSQANKESNRLQRNMSFVQQNIRSAMELLGRDIRQAGFYVDDDPANRILPPFSPFVVSATLDDADAGNTTGSDIITLNYESDVNCLNEPTFDSSNAAAVASNHFANNRWFIQNQRLMCGSNTGIPQPLVEGVENLQILYGENTDGDPRSANRYVRADQVGNMANVVSVRIGMRFISREAVRQTTVTESYALLDAAAVSYSDRLLRREITTTISLRNEQ